MTIEASNDGLVEGLGVGGAFEGRDPFARVLRAALDQAVERSTRRLCWCDSDFAAWPLGEPDWVASLTRWARSGGGRELVMIADDYRAIERLHPRFVDWRRDWAHIVQCKLPEEARPASLPTLWIDSDDHAIRIFDREQWRGRTGFDRIDRQRAREDFDALSQRATAGFSTVILGL